MKQLLAALWLVANLGFAATLAAGTAQAQPAPPNQMGVTMGHWHLNTTDVEANKKLFVALGGTAIKPGDFEIVKFPGVLVFLHVRPGSPPPTAGSVGSVVNHVGFLVPNVQEAVAKWKAAGVTVAPGGNGRLDQAFVTTPDGLRIEILEDKAQTAPIQHHHIHYAVTAEVIPEIQAWYAKTFGAKPGMRGTNVSDDLPGANLSFSKADAPAAPTKGRVLDHIGFDVTNLEAFTKQLEASGIKLDRPYTKNPKTGDALAFITDPWGTYIELNEHPHPLYGGATRRIAGRAPAVLRAVHKIERPNIEKNRGKP